MNSVRCPFSAALTTFSLVSDVNTPFMTKLGLLLAAAPLSISIPLLAPVPLYPKCKFLTSTLPPFARTAPYLNPVIETLSSITVAPS